MIFLTGGCVECGRMCTTNINAYVIEDGEVIKHNPRTNDPSVICASCYIQSYSEEAKARKKQNERDDKLYKILTPWYKRWFKLRKNEDNI